MFNFLNVFSFSQTNMETDLYIVNRFPIVWSYARKVIAFYSRGDAVGSGDDPSVAQKGPAAGKLFRQER